MKYSSKNMIYSSWSLFPKDLASIKLEKRVVSVTLYSRVIFLVASRSCLNFLKSKKSRESKKTSFVESGAFYKYLKLNFHYYQVLGIAKHKTLHKFQESISYFEFVKSKFLSFTVLIAISIIRFLILNDVKGLLYLFK